MKLRHPLAVLLLGLGTWSDVSAQEASPLHAEAARLFDRPAGQTIGDEQKARLADFLAEHPADQLGDLGYLPALQLYLQRDPAAAAARLDDFFAAFDAVPVGEHATMVGRVYLGSLARGAAEVEPAVLGRRAAACARLYDDGALLERVLSRVGAGLDGPRRVAFRTGVARGALANAALDDAARDRLLAAIYAAGAEPAVEAAGSAATPATPMRPAVAMARVRPLPVRPGAAEAANKATERRAALTGQPVPGLGDVAVAQGDGVQGDDDFALDAYRGKVVLLDFTATWCGPCRRVIPGLIQLQKDHADDLQVVAVSRFYTYGNDFSEQGGGARVQDLDRDTELRINRDFARHFEIPYPVVLVERQVMSEGFGVQGIPSLFVVGRDGRVVGHTVGAGEESEERLRELVEQALAR